MTDVSYRLAPPGDPWVGYDASGTYDELLRSDGSPQHGRLDVVKRLIDLGPDVLARQQSAESAIRAMGVTFTLTQNTPNPNNGASDRDWPIDIIPRVIPLNEWERVERGLVQRLAALNHFIDDVYHHQRIVAAGRFPRELLASSAQFVDSCVGVSPPGGIWAHVCGCDLVRDETGEFFVLEDNLRIPSGVSYMLANREVGKRVFADLFRDLDILPVDAYTDHLGARLRALSPRTDVEPVVVLLTPGIHNSAYFEHVHLASRMGVHLVEGSDLFVDDDVVYVRTVSGPVRVDVIYRRIDDQYLDPAVFLPDSVLSPAGTMAAWRKGNVAIANAPGAGVADDKVVYSYVPDFIDYYLGEEPILSNVDTWRCTEPSHAAHVLAHLDELVCKPANGAGGKGVTVGSTATTAELAELRAHIESDPRNWIAQPILRLSTTPTIGAGSRIGPRHVDLRPFVLSGADPYVTAGGLTRVALREGSLVVNSSLGGGSKDTWIVDSATRPTPWVEQPVPADLGGR